MRAKLERIAAGKIDYENKPLKLSMERIDISCSPGGRAEGSFTLTADRIVKGVIYVSTSRLGLEHTSFHGRIARINYYYDASGLAGEEEETGEICIVSDAGEYIIPYTVHVLKPPAKEDNYTYFVTADPIEPQVVSASDKAACSAVVELTGGSVAPDSEMDRERLSSIISLLIKNGNTDRESFAWYKRGVEEELKLTNIYEYFMLTVPEDYNEPLPQNLLLYFQMENHLNDRQKAFLYANILKYQSPFSDVYRGYVDRMEKFMLDQLLRRRISRDLSVIYGDLLVEGILTIDFAEALADVMFLRLLKCSDKRIREVRVFYDQLDGPICVPMSGGQAYVPIYTPGAVILLADARGNLYSTSVPYTLEKLMDERRYAGRCRELLRYHQGLYLYLCDGTSKYHVITSDNVENYKRIFGIKGFTAKYREEVRQEILRYYYDDNGLDELDREFFITQTDVMSFKERGRYTEILILRGLYDDAWEMIRKSGYGAVRAAYLIKLAAWKIKETEYAENDFLIKLCYHIFQQHKYNENTLEYLTWYYYGSCAALGRIRREAIAFELNVFELEERLLAQMIFTGKVDDDSFAVYRDYRMLGGSGLVGKAYLAVMSYDGFVKERALPEGFHGFLESAVDWEEDLPDVCLLEYLKYLSEKKNLNSARRAAADRLLEGFLRRKIRYGFMKTLSEKLGKPWILEDRTFVEYRTDPAHKVTIHYCIEVPDADRVDYVTERLYPSQPGVFVKEFTLFYGWRLTWFFTETADDGTRITSADASYTEKNDKKLVSGTKYAYIYEMSREMKKRSRTGAQKKLMEYSEMNYMAESLFSLK